MLLYIFNKLEVGRFLNEIILVLAEFGGGTDPQDDVVRFLLPSIFWISLFVFSYLQWQKERLKKDYFVFIASVVGLSREMFMFFMEYGAYRGFFSYLNTHFFYPPFEHALTMLSVVIIGFAFLSVFLNNSKFSKTFMVVSITIIAGLYIVTAPQWYNFLKSNPQALFGSFWGDMAFRIVASVMIGTVIISLYIGKKRGKDVPVLLFVPFIFLFLDEFLMIFNLLENERYRHIYKPIRHNLHIWAVPFFIIIYWKEIFNRISATEKRLQQAQKMEALGNLASGIVHDFNNILTVISGWADIIMLNSMDEKSREQASKISFAVDRASNITSQLLAFCRKQMIQSKPIDINETVTKSISIFSRLLPENIEIQASIHKEPLFVMSDPTLIEQLIINLVTNARDAMPDGGVLKIETSLSHENEIAKGRNEECFYYAVITVSDTGEGIDEDIKSKIFEPFFSTKEIGKGTGLGLSTVHGIVKQHNGDIRVFSKKGKGTRFDIYLPLTDKRPVTEVLRPLKSKTVLKGTILIVDDDISILEFLKAAFHYHGWKVLTASSSEEALRISENCKQGIDILLTDIVMPRINGKTLSNLILTTQPNIRTIYMTGYFDDSILDREPIKSDQIILRKPIKLEELIDVISRLDSI